MKDILSYALNNIKKNGQIWILAIVAFTLLMTIGISLSYLIGMVDVLIIAFVVCPFIFTFINICDKSINDSYLEPKDIYFGYKGLGKYLAVFIRTLIRPALLFLLIYFGVYMLVAVFDLFFLNYSMIEKMIALFQNGASSEELTSFLMYDTDYLNRVKIANYIAIGLTFLLLNLFLNKRIFSLLYFYNVGNPFIRYNYIVANNKEIRKYKLFRYDLLFSLFIIVGFVLAVLAYIFISNTIDNVLIPYLVSALIFYLIYSIGVPLKYSVYTIIFNDIFKNDVELLKNQRV